MSGGVGDSRTLLGALTALTVVSGMVDAISYLGLGRVFTANMTGNVVVLGFATAGAPGFSMAASATSIAAFLLGAVVSGRLCLHLASKRHWFLAAMLAEAFLAGGAAAVSAVAGTIGSGWPRYTVIGLLAFAMGIRNSTIRRMAVPDMTTTVLTMTLTGLAADSTLAGGGNPHAGRRAAAFAAMLIGAFVGAALYLHQGATVPLMVVAVLVLATAMAYTLSPASGRLDTRA